MKRLIHYGLAAVLTLPFAAPFTVAHAQVSNALVINACGTAPSGWVVGQFLPLTQDTTATLCTEGSSAPSIVNGFTATGAAQPGQGALIGGTFHTLSVPMIDGDSFPLQLDNYGATKVCLADVAGATGSPGRCIDATLPAQVNLMQVNGIAGLAGNGHTGAGSQRVTIADDNTPFMVGSAQGSTTAGLSGPLVQGAVTTAAPTYTTTQTSPLSLTTGGGLRTDASGSTGTKILDTAGTNAATVKAASTAPTTTDTALVVAQSPNPGGSPCSNPPIPINQTASTDLKTFTNTNKGRICSIMLVSATAQNVSLVEGTNANCAAGTVGLIGGTTASLALAANGGFALGNDRTLITLSITTGGHLCLFQSGAGNVSGFLTWSDAP